MDFQDLLEHSYLKLSTKEHRKTFAQFFTPPAIASLMAAYILDNKECSKILDPANGLTIFGRALDEHLKLINHRSFDCHYQILNTLSYASWTDLSSRHASLNSRTSTRRSSLTSLFCNHTELHHILALSQVPLRVCLSGVSKESYVSAALAQSQPLNQTQASATNQAQDPNQAQSPDQAQSLNQSQTQEYVEQSKQRSHLKLQHETPCNEQVNAELSADYLTSHSDGKSTASFETKSTAGLAVLDSKSNAALETRSNDLLEENTVFNSSLDTRLAFNTLTLSSYQEVTKDNYLPLEWFTNSPRFSMPKLEHAKLEHSTYAQNSAQHAPSALIKLGVPSELSEQADAKKSLSTLPRMSQPMSLDSPDSTRVIHTASTPQSTDALHSTVKPHLSLDTPQMTSVNSLEISDKLRGAISNKQYTSSDLNSLSLILNQQYGAFAELGCSLSSSTHPISLQHSQHSQHMQHTQHTLSLSAQLSLEPVADAASHTGNAGDSFKAESASIISNDDRFTAESDGFTSNEASFTAKGDNSAERSVPSQTTHVVFQPIDSQAHTSFAMQSLRNNDLPAADTMLSRTEGTLLSHILRPVCSETENTLLQSNLAFYAVKDDNTTAILDSESLVEKVVSKSLTEKVQYTDLDTSATLDTSDTAEEILCISSVSDVPERKVHLVAYEIDPIIAEFASLSATQIPMRFVDVDFRLKDYLKSNFKDRYDGIICNPPYKTFKEFARKSHFITLIEERLDLKLSGTTNLYALFLLKSLSQLKPNGRCAYLIPYEFLNSSFGIKIKEQFLKQRNLAYVITFDVKGSVFDNATTTCGLFLFDNSQEQKQVEFITLHTIDEIEQLMIRLCPNLIASYPETHRSFQRYVSALSTNRNAEQAGLKKTHSLLDDLMLSLDRMCPLPSNVQQALALAPSLVSALPNPMLYSLLSQAQAMRNQTQPAKVSADMQSQTQTQQTALTSSVVAATVQNPQTLSANQISQENTPQHLSHVMNISHMGKENEVNQVSQNMEALQLSQNSAAAQISLNMDGAQQTYDGLLDEVQQTQDSLQDAQTEHVKSQAASTVDAPLLNELSKHQLKLYGHHEQHTQDNHQVEYGLHGLNNQTVQCALSEQTKPLKQDANYAQSEQQHLHSSIAQSYSTESSVQFNQGNVHSTQETIQSNQRKDLSSPNSLTLNGRIVPYSQLKAKQKWHVYYQSRKLTLQNSDSHLTSDSALTTFDQFIKVKRGLATGANEFFLFNRSKVAATKIPEQYFVKVIPRSNFIQRPIFTLQDFEQLEKQDAMVYLLNAPAQPDEPNLKKYLAYGESLEIHKRYLTRHRCPWYALERRQVAPILVSVFNRGSMQVVRNEAQIFNLTTFHSVFILQKDKTELIFAYLLTDLAKEIILQNRREYGGGLEKLEPLDINHAACINFNQMPYADEQDVLQLYRKYRQQILHTNPNFKEVSLLIEKMSAIFQHML